MDSIIGTEHGQQELVHRHDAHLILWDTLRTYKIYIPFQFTLPPCVRSAELGLPGEAAW